MTGFGGLFIVVVVVAVVAVMVECRTKRKKGVEQQLKGKHIIHWQQRLYHNASTSTRKKQSHFKARSAQAKMSPLYVASNFCQKFKHAPSIN